MVILFCYIAAGVVAVCVAVAVIAVAIRRRDGAHAAAGLFATAICCAAAVGFIAFTDFMIEDGQVDEAERDLASALAEDAGVAVDMDSLPYHLFEPDEWRIDGRWRTCYITGDELTRSDLPVDVAQTAATRTIECEAPSVPLADLTDSEALQ